MKKIIFIMILSLNAAFFACGDDDLTTLRWKNDTYSNETISEIKWYDTSGYYADTQNQTWHGETAPGAVTSFQEITKLTGRGKALDGALYEVDIVLPGSGDWATIEKNTDATLVIEDLQ